MRVGIVGLLQESNTFINGQTTLAHFEQDLLCEGAEIERRMADAHHEVGGFFEGLAAAGIEAVPIFLARALPYGTMQRGVLEELLARMDRALDRAGRLDGLLAAPHGATVSETAADVDGYWLARLRTRFGTRFPIIATFDLHANISAQLVAACDALIGYRSNPHLDQRARGVEAAKLMARTLGGEVRPTMAANLLPLAVNIERQLTSAEPCQSLYGRADAMLAAPGVLTNSVALGFPYADVAQMGSAIVVVTNNDWAKARMLADDLANHWWSRREEFNGQFITVDQALDRAVQLDGSVCLLDMGDNVGGGSPADGTLLAHGLHQRQMGPSFVCLYDPAAYELAQAAGLDARVTLSIGGKTDALHGSPLTAEFTVGRFAEGKFSEPNPRHGGIVNFNMGPTAIVTTDAGLTVMITSRRCAPMSLNQLVSCGLDPGSFRYLVAKGVHAPVAAYREVCRHLIRVDTPGVTSADLRRLEYHHRRPMYPFEPDMTWVAGNGAQAKVGSR
ncbi:MAG: M81 family metallopeptidase [Planctomycetes bacterium]|nr:M81 family metallopeptidase [Planctomycetota bacterium]